MSYPIFIPDVHSNLHLNLRTFSKLERQRLPFTNSSTNNSNAQAHITLTAARRGDVQLYLTSPGGTKSQLLARRPHDSSRAGFQVGWPAGFKISTGKLSKQRDFSEMGINKKKT